MLLVHGLGSAGYIEWRFNVPSLALSRRVLAPDLPGFGRSAKPTARYGVPYFARTLEEYLQQLRVRSVDVVGASLGGRVALELTLRNRSLVRRLVLVNSFGLGRPNVHLFYPLVTIPRVGEAVMRLLGRGLRSASPDIVRRVAARYTGTQAELEKVIDEAYLADMREMHSDEDYPTAYLATVRSLLQPQALVRQRNLVRRLAATRIPVLLVWGTEDRLFPVEHATRAHAQLPDSRLALIEGAGHTPQAERPEEFNRLVAEFLGS